MSLLIFILVLAVIVLVHEWGHFFAARRFGIRVDEFGFGFPPRLAGKKVGKTLYSLNLFPLGGFVKIFGEVGEGEGDKESFIMHPVWRRVVVIVAGVFMNLVLAWVLFTFGHIIGTPSVNDGNADVTESGITITNVAEGSPAAAARLAFGDIIAGIQSPHESIQPKTAEELIQFVNKHKGERLTLLIKPNANASRDQIHSVYITGRVNPPPGQGSLGIALADIGILRSPWYLAPWRGLESVWFSLKGTAEALFGIFHSAVRDRSIPEGVSGPLGLFTLTGQTARLGISYFIQFVALISINLAILNIIPFPALDGGRVLFLVIEKIRGKPIHFEYERMAHTVGFLLLLVLILFISYRDIHRFFL
jgi:regulator of sigma E protease